MLKYAKLLLFLIFIPILYFNSGATDITIGSVGNNFSIPISVVNPYNVTFSNNGSYMYIGTFGSTVYQFSLPTPYDVTTSVYMNRSKDLSAQGTGMDEIRMNNDGDKLFVLQFYSSAILQYTLTTPHNLLSIRYDSISKSISGSNNYTFDVKPDGTKIITMTDFNNLLYEYSLSSPWNLASISTSPVSSLATPNFAAGQKTAMGFTYDGNSLYIKTNTNNRVHWLALGSPWVITTAVYTSGKYVDLNSTDTQIRAIASNSASNKLFLTGSTNKRIYEYNLNDTVAPTISSVTSTTSNGTYKAGDSVNITVNFSESVTSTGDVTVTLETGTNDRTCTFTVTSASSASCTYTVQAGDTSSDLDIVSISGTIKDASNNSMSNFVPTTSLSSSKNIVIDTSNPTLSSVSASSSNNSATITWTSNENGSSLVYYGLNTGSDFSSAESNTSPRVTSHSLSLSNLLSCTIYKYNAGSRDAGLNETTSPGTFTTTGCGVSSVSTGVTSQVNLSGGTLTLPNSGSIGKLVIPNNYYPTQASFQINLLNTTNFNSLASSQTLAGGNLFKLVSLTDNNTTIPTFSANITFEITYSDAVASDYNEDTLKVYKFNGSTWIDKSCTVNSSINKITCLLSDFSVYGLFGDLKVSDAGSSQNNSNNQNGKIVFSKDTRCHFYEPPSLTWVDFKVGKEDGINGLYVFWSQLDADRVNIKIDDGTGTYPWIETNISNTGKYFLKNVAPWQKIKIQAINNCYPGDFSQEFSKSKYPNGWFNK